MKIMSICKHCSQTKQLQQLLKNFFASSFSMPCIKKFSGDKAHLKTTQNFQYDVVVCPEKYRANNVTHITILYETQNYFSPIFSSSYATMYITKWIWHDRDISSFIQYMTSVLLSDIDLKMHNECFIMLLFCSFATLCAGHVLICDMDMMKFLLKS